MSSSIDPVNGQATNIGFSVVHQKVELDLELLARRLKGRTEITINPHFKELRSVRLNCRQCDIKKITANGKACPNFAYEEPYRKAALRWEAGVHQHHMLKKKLEPQLKSPPEEELVVTLPKSVKIDDLDPFSVEASALGGGRSSIGLKDDSLGEVASARTAVEPDRRYTPVTITIEFAVPYIRDGIQFVGWEEEDLRYPHAYTSFSNAGSVCCIFPCVDDLTARCTWEISIKCSKTIGDAYVPPQSNVVNGIGNHSNGGYSHVASTSEDPFPANLNPEDKALDLAVICTGDLTDEVVLLACCLVYSLISLG